jgi:hypothetical protein
LIELSGESRGKAGRFHFPPPAVFVQIGEHAHWKGKQIMRKAVVFLVSAAMVTSLAGTALADAGGVPNSNASPPSNGNGRKADCSPPGADLSVFAKMPGSNSDPLDMGLSPGQLVVTFCNLGPN